MAQAIENMEIRVNHKEVVDSGKTIEITNKAELTSATISKQLNANSMLRIASALMERTVPLLMDRLRSVI
jgi:hypothetical protein